MDSKTIKRSPRLATRCQRSLMPTEALKMLIDENVIKNLPSLYEQDNEDDPMIFAVLATVDHGWSCYLAEAEKQDDDYAVFGLFLSKKFGHSWSQVTLQELERDLSDARLEAHLVYDGIPARASELTGIVRRCHDVRALP